MIYIECTKNPDHCEGHPPEMRQNILVQSHSPKGFIGVGPKLTVKILDKFYTVLGILAKRRPHMCRDVRKGWRGHDFSSKISWAVFILSRILPCPF